MTHSTKQPVTIPDHAPVEFNFLLTKYSFSQIFNARELLSCIYHRLMTNPNPILPKSLAQYEQLHERFLIAHMTYRAETANDYVPGRRLSNNMASISITLPRYTQEQADQLHDELHQLRRTIGVTLDDHRSIEFALKNHLHARMQHLPSSFIAPRTSFDRPPHSYSLYALDDKFFTVTLPGKTSRCSVSFHRSPSVLDPTPVPDRFRLPTGTPHSRTPFFDNYIWEYSPNSQHGFRYAIGKDLDNITPIGKKVELEIVNRTIMSIIQFLDRLYQ